MAGAPIDWSGRYQGERRIKRVLPTYPFERRRYWIVDHAQPAQQAGAPRAGGPGRPGARATPNYSHGNRHLAPRAILQSAGSKRQSDATRWLVFNPTEKIDKRIAAALRQRGDKVTIVEKGPRFRTYADGRVTLDPTDEVDLAQLCKTVMKSLAKRQRLQVVYFCAPSPERKAELVEARYRADIDDKLNIPIMLTRSLMQAGNPENVTITFVTREGQQISGLETIDPSMAMPIGPSLAAMREYPKLTCRVIDILSEVASPEIVARRISADLPYPSPSIVTAYRGKSRWARGI